MERVDHGLDFRNDDFFKFMEKTYITIPYIKYYNSFHTYLMNSYYA